MAAPQDPGRDYETSLSDDRRRREGIHYTPAEVASDVVARALALLDRLPGRVLDPTCGGGAFLVATLDALVARGIHPTDALGRVRGIDVDRDAVSVARRVLRDWARSHGLPPTAVGRGTVRVGDALGDRWPAGVDLVVGNPPFGGQLRGSTVRDRARADAATAILGSAAGYADTAGLFLVRAVRSVAPAGVVALLQPASVLANRDAAAVRAIVDGCATVREVVLPDPSGFDASVHVCVPMIVCDGGGADASRSWSELAADALGLATVDLGDDGPTLGDVADLTAGFRDEFYAVARFVEEAVDDDDPRPRLVTVGAIEPGRVLWGERRATVLRRRFSRPVVDVDGLRTWAAGPEGDRRIDARLATRTRPKVLVATQTRVIEAVVDPDGRLWPAVPVVSVLPTTVDVWHVLAVLASREATAWTARRTVGTGLSAGASRPSARVLAALPVPTAARRGEWDVASRLLERGAAVDDPTVLDAMTRAYGRSD